MSIISKVITSIMVSYILTCNEMVSLLQVYCMEQLLTIIVFLPKKLTFSVCLAGVLEGGTSSRVTCCVDSEISPGRIDTLIRPLHYPDTPSQYGN